MAVAYVRKEGRDFIGWTDVGGQYVEKTKTLADGTQQKFTEPELLEFLRSSRGQR